MDRETDRERDVLDGLAGEAALVIFDVSEKMKSLSVAMTLATVTGIVRRALMRAAREDGVTYQSLIDLLHERLTMTAPSGEAQAPGPSSDASAPGVEPGPSLGGDPGGG